LTATGNLCYSIHSGFVEPHVAFISRNLTVTQVTSFPLANYSVGVCESKNGGDTVIIKISKLEENEMILPKDSYMLLSAVNMKLRDNYKLLDELCEDMDEKPEEISAALQKIGYVYSKELNQFAPVFEEKNTLSENGAENSQ
jgi:hypothetical protein